MEITGTINFVWNIVSNATEYKLEYSGASTGICDWNSATSCTVNLTAGTYGWRVKARNAGGESNWSDTWTFNLIADIVIKPRDYIWEKSTSAQGIQKPGVTVSCSVNGPNDLNVIYWRTNDLYGWVHWIPNIPISGNYDIYVYLPNYNPINADITTQAAYYLNGVTPMGNTVDQSQNKCTWYLLGKYYLNAGTGNYVHMPSGTSENPYHLISADGMMFRWSP